MTATGSPSTSGRDRRRPASCGSLPGARDRRADWVAGEQRSALILLVSGRFRVDLPGRSALLAEQGDYVVFRGVGHSWEAEDAPVVVAVRRPSIPGYAVSEEARS